MNKPKSELESLIGYSFGDKKLLKAALTHSSYINENKKEPHIDNERLEFLGDAVIEFFVSEYLFEKYSDRPEGDLTRTRASMVCESALAKCAEAIDLGSFLFMGRGEELTGGRTLPSVTSDAFEALTAAVYLDSGMEETKKFIYKHLIEPLKGEQLFFDAKTSLQELIQQRSGSVLSYELVSEEGPVHSRTFTEAVLLNGKEIGRGSGRSKKEAQQRAAQDALGKMSSARGNACD